MGERTPNQVYDSHEAYHPSKGVERLLTFNAQLLEEIQTKSPEARGFRLIEEYCNAVTGRMVDVEPDAIKAQAANDGNNITSPVIMYANFEGGGDDRKFVESVRDLDIAHGILVNKIDRKYGNLSAYKLWAGLYLDLR